jgi:hypothetical protein
MVAHALAELHESMLDVTRVLIVVQVFADLFVGNLASKPGVPPEQERHEYDQPRGEEEEQSIAGGHAGA